PMRRRRSGPGARRPGATPVPTATPIPTRPTPTPTPTWIPTRPRRTAHDDYRPPGSPRAPPSSPRRARDRSTLLKASMVMAVGSMISRLLGFVRNFLFGAVLGGSMSSAANAFSAANTLPNTIWLLVGGGTLNAILVPAI